MDLDDFYDSYEIIYNPNTDLTDSFSPRQMYQMLYEPFEEGCPVQLRTLTDRQIEQVPIMRQILHLMTMLSRSELKLTARGYIPPKIVEELYTMGTHSWGTDWYKQKSEPKTVEVQFVRLVVKACGLTKVRAGMMSLTAKGNKLLADRNGLLREVMLFLMRDYNTGWMDLYDAMDVGNVGRLYLLWLLHHYGCEWRYIDFYSSQYSRAFPTIKGYMACGIRIFERLFHYIGLCELNEKDEDVGMDYGKKVIKTDVLELVFQFTEP